MPGREVAEWVAKSHIKMATIRMDRNIVPTRRKGRIRALSQLGDNSCTVKGDSSTTTRRSRRLNASRITEFLFQISIIGNYKLIGCWGNEQVDLSCDAMDDYCLSPNNGFCDSELEHNLPGCERGDCIDCQIFCGQYDYDCDGCISSGCYWCPGDAKCYNTDLYMFENENATSCNVQTDYVHRTSLATNNDNVCTQSGNYFR